MKNIKYILLSAWSFFMLSACTEVMEVTLPSEADKVVIEGLVSTLTQPYKVKVTKTTVLDNEGNYPTVNNALVIVADNLGNSDTLFQTAPGVYETSSPQTGVVGRTYYLTVVIDGATYFAQDEILPVSPIDSLYAVYLQAGSSIGVIEDAYYVFYNSTDPAVQKNYYLNKIFRNGVSVLEPSQVFVYDDRFLAPLIIGYRLPGTYAQGDMVKFEKYGLSETAFTFYSGLATQLQNDGGFFSTPPANAVSNLSNGALGFFQASDIKVDSLIVP